MPLVLPKDTKAPVLKRGLPTVMAPAPAVTAPMGAAAFPPNAPGAVTPGPVSPMAYNR